MLLRITACRYRSHKDITDVTDPLRMENMIRKSLNIFQHFPNQVTCRNPAVHPAMCNWGLTMLSLKGSCSYVDLPVFHFL